MSAKLRSACTPPAVAQAPMVTSSFDCSRISRMRCSSCRVVIEPSTSDTSYGPADHCAGRLGEGGDLHLVGEGEQLVLAVEQRQLATVAGGELPHGQRGSAHLKLLHLQQRSRDVVTDDGPVAAQQ